MNRPTTFLERVRPVIDAMPEGPDKDKLLELAESQDTIERSDVHPKQRAQAMRRLLGGAAMTGRKTLRQQVKGRGKKP